MSENETESIVIDVSSEGVALEIGQALTRRGIEVGKHDHEKSDQVAKELRNLGWDIIEEYRTETDNNGGDS